MVNVAPAWPHESQMRRRVSQNVSAESPSRTPRPVGAPLPHTRSAADTADRNRQYARMSDRERRQYALMQQRIDSLREGESSIGPVIGDLEGLVNALEETPEEWKDSFIEECSALEIAYAVALDRQHPLPTARDHDIATALDALSALIVERTGNRA